ncbi:MAG: hypothetical protein QM399_08260 [Bacillota bacterium]|nr:hypothetical protein [Bacillota bacterium]
MRKIRDRVLLGFISGLGGGAVKNAISAVLIKRGMAEYGGPARAAGMLVPAHNITTKRGRLVGWIADATICGILGVVCVYALSVTGKEKAPLKGALIGGVAAWTALYGALGTMGVTQVQDPAPKTVLSEFFVHTVYGAATAAIATYLGDEDLYNGNIPWSAVSRGGWKTVSPRPPVQRSYHIQRHFVKG